ELTGIVNLLDPEGRGVISYSDFCEGVQQIIDIQQQASRDSFKGSVSEETLVPLDIAGDLSVLEHTSKSSPSPSSQHTFSEYDYNSQDDFSGLSLTGPESSTSTPKNSNYNSLNLIDDSGPDGVSGGPAGEEGLVLPETELNGTPLIIPPASEDEADSAISGKSSEINENSRQEITDEENYEDYGEIESEADTSDQGHLTPSIQRKRGDRRDPLSRHHKRSCSSRNRLTTAALASHLQRSARNSPSSTRRSSLGSDEIFDDIDGNFQDVNGRLKFLEEQLQHLTEVQTETNTKQVKLKDENSLLVQKVHYLEEQLRDMEVKAEDLLSEEKRKHKEFMARQERDKNEQVEYITQRLHRIEREYEDLKEEAPRLHAEIAKLRTEKMDLQERLLERQENYNVLYDDHERLKADYHKQNSLQQKERQATGQLLDEMGKELEDLRHYKLEVENGTRVPGSKGDTAELPARYTDLQREIHKLKEDMWSEWKHLWKVGGSLVYFTGWTNSQFGWIYFMFLPMLSHIAPAPT
ncbi:Rab11 family-interacting protein 4, partial [Plakobranchus ocellatus]